MNFFEKILKALDGSMPRPVSFGWFHFLCLGIVIVAAVLLAWFGRKTTDKQNRIIMLVLSLTMIIFEIYKQLNYSYTWTTDTWSYQWYAFPFQFCSTPMFIGLIAACIPKGRVQEAMFCFLGTFGLFAGLSVMLYPNDVFINTIGINIQTMLHHGIMLIMGVYVLSSGRAKLKWTTILKASIVFVALTAMAIIMDIIYVKAGGNQTFNMFYISPYFECTLPVLSLIYLKVPYYVFLPIYILGFMLAGFVILLIAMGINWIIQKAKNNKSKKNESQLRTNLKE